MSQITDLKDKIAGVHGQAASTYIVNSTQDLLLEALNNARLQAEQLHDFEHCYVLADLVVDGVAGGDYDTDAKLHGTADAVKIKTIEDIGKFNTETGSFYPVEWARMKDFNRDVKRIRELGNFALDPDFRAPSDAQWEAEHSGCGGVVIYGTQVYLKPQREAGQTTTIGIQGQRWLDDYTDATDDDSDIFLRHGRNYLFYAGICEVNFLNRKFAPREEGNVPAPTKERDAALEAFLRWDTFSQRT